MSRCKNHGASNRSDSYLKMRSNQATPSRWWEKAEGDGLLDGHGACARRLRQLAKKDKRKFKRSHQHWADVRRQLGEEVWENGMISLGPVGKPRGVKKAASAVPDTVT